MDNSSKERLDEVLTKEPEALSQGDIDFLRARRSYLNADQLAKYASVLPQEDGSDADNNEDSKPLADLSDKELNKLAKSLDISPKDFESREDLIAEIEAKQAA